MFYIFLGILIFVLIIMLIFKLIQLLFVPILLIVAIVTIHRYITNKTSSKQTYTETYRRYSNDDNVIDAEYSEVVGDE